MSERKLTINRDGQRYIDEPVTLKPIQPTCLQQSIAEAFGSASSIPRQRLVVNYERVLLRWMEPDGNGGVRPRKGVV